jgi:DNA-binding MarR family transcriptional regulator
MREVLTDIDHGAANQPINPLDLLLGYQLRRASLVMLSDLTATIADLALTVTEVSILVVISANPDISQSEIGRMLSIQRANMAPLTAALVQRKLVRRTAASGRTHALRLTNAGTAMVKECHDRIARHEAKFLKKIKRAEQLVLLTQLRRIRQE